MAMLITLLEETLGGDYRWQDVAEVFSSSHGK